jgi:hypothetical protein
MKEKEIQIKALNRLFAHIGLEQGECPSSELLDAYTTGTLPPALREPVEQHVKNCAECRELVARVKSAIQIGEQPSLLNIVTNTGAESEALSPRHYTDMQLIMAKVRKQLSEPPSKRVSWLRHLSLGCSLGSRLAWASVAVLALFAVVWIVIRPHSEPLAFEFAAFAERGPSPSNAAQPLDGKFVLEADLSRSKIRLVEGPLSCSGTFAALPKDPLAPSTITTYSFEARGTNQTGEIVVVRGELRLTQKVSGKPSRTQADVGVAYISGTVKIGSRQPYPFDRRWKGP